MLELLLWIGLFLLFYSYLFYPLILKIASKNKTLTYPTIPSEELPPISIVMAAHNEEKVIETKIRSVLDSNYPKHLIEFIIGSDNSSDRTNEILLTLKEEHPQLNITIFTERQGKINIFNQLVPTAKNDIIISTDANNIFQKDTMVELVSSLCSDDKIGLVDSLILHTDLKADGMSLQENTYISSEANIKYNEGLLFDVTAGPFGGCYIFRKDLWTNIPSNYLVDDLFVHTWIVKKGYKTFFNKNAITNEDVSNNPILEFKRKIRIATGSFQNLFTFFSDYINPFSNFGFVMLSHKVVRWSGPFLLLFVLVATIFLVTTNLIYSILLVIELCSIFLCIIDIIQRKFNIHLYLIRHLTHFYLSNIAILLGFVRFIRGVKSSI